MTHQDQTEREDIEFLLPWYEKGTLNAREMERVERRLAEDEELRSRLALIREEVPETIFANEALGMPGNAARDRLFAQIEAEAGPVQSSGGLRLWLSRLLPAGFSPGVTIAGAVAAVIIIVQAVTLVSLLPGDGQPGGYSVASGEDAAGQAQGTFILVRFNDEATAPEISGLLRDTDATIVDGPKPGGVFKLQVSEKALSQTERDEILAALKQESGIVAFAAPTR